MTFISSIKRNKTGILLMLCSSCFTATGQLLWKLSNASDIPLVLAGFFVYGLGALFMIIALKHGSLSILHPMLSFGYALAVILGFLFLNEAVSLTKILGIMIIMFGVTLIGGSDV